MIITIIRIIDNNTEDLSFKTNTRPSSNTQCLRSLNPSRVEQNYTILYKKKWLKLYKKMAKTI